MVVIVLSAGDFFVVMPLHMSLYVDVVDVAVSVLWPMTVFVAVLTCRTGRAPSPRNTENRSCALACNSIASGSRCI